MYRFVVLEYASQWIWIPFLAASLIYCWFTLTVFHCFWIHAKVTEMYNSSIVYYLSNLARKTSYLYLIISLQELLFYPCFQILSNLFIQDISKITKLTVELRFFLQNAIIVDEWLINLSCIYLWIWKVLYFRLI